MGDTSYDLTVLSLGAGTQSSAALMLALRGELPEGYPPLDAAVFADTGDEPQAVYDYVEVLRGECDRAGVPLIVTQDTRGSLSSQITDTERYGLVAMPPVAVRREDNADDPKPSRFMRQCSSEVKVRPLRRAYRELLGVSRTHGRHVLELVGISTDEAHRMKPPDVNWITRAWPLVDLRMRRNDSIQYLRRIGLPDPPRSACVYCPYADNTFWRRMRDEQPEDWQRAVEVDRRLREANRERRELGLRYIEGDLYVHGDGVPLDEADLSREEDYGQGSLFGEECEGMCGV